MIAEGYLSLSLLAIALLLGLISGLKWYYSYLGAQLHLWECGWQFNSFEIRLISG
jgi:hypothetical protein